MKILSISDIHNNIAAVRKLIDKEDDRFDAIIIAGDIGSECFDDTIILLTKYNCPILFVFGNWDHDINYNLMLHKQAIHLHNNIVCTSDACFVGFSGCKSNWGNNEIASSFYREFNAKNSIEDLYDEINNLKKSSSLKNVPFSEKSRIHKEICKIKQTDRYRAYQKKLIETDRLIEKLNVENINDILKNNANEVSDKFVIIVSHERIVGISELMNRFNFHIFGHRHTFNVTRKMNNVYINTSCLDEYLCVKMKNEFYRTLSGSYAIIQADDEGWHVDHKRLCGNEIKVKIDNYALYALAESNPDDLKYF